MNIETIAVTTLCIKFTKINSSAILPSKKYNSDAGYDLFLVEDIVCKGHNSVIAPIGLKVAYIPDDYWFRIEPRSGLGFNKNIQPHIGIIDNGYRGELKIKLYNFGNEDVYLKKGTAVAQFIVYKSINTDVIFTEELITNTERQDNGFGSSDKV